MEKSKWRRPFLGSSFFAVLILVVSFFVGFDYPSVQSSSEPDAKPSPTASADSESGCETWMTRPSDYSNNRWIGQGLASIRDAVTNEEAADAGYDWLEEIRQDPILLEAGAEKVLGRDIDAATLSSDGCATEEAVKLTVELQMTFASSKIISEDAPANGYNSGVEDGIVVGSPGPGIGGDRSAIKITLPDGRVIWILARCGNIVTSTPPSLPPGKTDNPVCPPEMPHGTPETGCKDGVEQAPSQQGNLPEQQKPNPLPAKPEHAQPVQPAVPGPVYTPPAQPAPAPAPSIKPNPPAPAPVTPPVVVDPGQDNGPSDPPPADW